MTTIKMTQTGDNFAEIVRQIPTPTTLDEVPAALYAIVEAWREFEGILDAEINKNPRNPIEALGAATAGGALGVLRMVAGPTIENLARAIDEKLTADLDAAAAAWHGPQAVELPNVEVDDTAADVITEALTAVDAGPGYLETIEAWADRTGYADLHDELYSDADPTPAAGTARPEVEQ